MIIKLCFPSPVQSRMRSCGHSERRGHSRKDEWLLFRCLWHHYPSTEYIFLHPLGTQRLMEHESGIFLGVVRLSHAPVWRGAAGDACMRLRPTGHAGRVWANSGVNIEGSNWRTARRGIPYISGLCGSAYNVVTFSGEKKTVFVCQRSLQIFAQHSQGSPDTHVIHSAFYWSQLLLIEWAQSSDSDSAVHVAHTTSCRCPSFSSNLAQLQQSY